LDDDPQDAREEDSSHESTMVSVGELKAVKTKKEDLRPSFDDQDVLCFLQGIKDNLWEG